MEGGWKDGDDDKRQNRDLYSGQGLLVGLMRWNGMGGRKGFVYSRSLRNVLTQKKRGTRVTNKEWREFWKEMESQGIVGLAVRSNWFWWFCQFWGRSSPENPLEVLGTCGSVACGLHQPVYLQDGYYVLDTIPNQYRC